jgi:DNA-binding transcriptional regulator YdaS (Cro superfamily)
MTTQKSKRITVAEYINGAIDLSDKTQRQITQEIGYENPNVLTMIKQGRTKLPINKVAAIARALGVDPANLLRIVMVEYMPEAWEVISQVMGDRVVSADESALLDLVREETKGVGADMHDPDLVDALRTAFREHHKRAEANPRSPVPAAKRGAAKS